MQNRKSDTNARIYNTEIDSQTQKTDLWLPKNKGREEGYPGGSVVKNLPANAEDERDTGLIPGSGRSPGEGTVNPLQYSCLGNPTDRGAWQAIVHEVAKKSDMTQ